MCLERVGELSIVNNFFINIEIFSIVSLRVLVENNISAPTDRFL